MRFLIAFAIFAFILVVNIEAGYFNIEIPEEHYEQVIDDLMADVGEKYAEGTLTKTEQNINIVIPDESFVSEIEKLLDQIQEQLPEETEMKITYSVLEDADSSMGDIFKNLGFIESEEILEDDDEYLENEYSEDDDAEYSREAAFDDDHFKDDDADYLGDEYVEDESSEEDEHKEDEASEKSQRMEDSEEDTEITEASNLCMPRMCPRIYLPLCASVDGVMRTWSSPCEYSNMVRCTATTNSRMGRAIPSFRVLSGGTCDEYKEEKEALLSRKERVAFD